MQTFGMDFLYLKSIENVWTLLKNQMHAMRATSLSKTSKNSDQKIQTGLCQKFLNLL